MASPAPANPSRMARCSCGRAFRGPFELTAHLLAEYPPNAPRPPEDARHAEVTPLADKLRTGRPEGWLLADWASDHRKHLRLAASIAMKYAADELKPWTAIRQQDLQRDFHVSAAIARAARAELRTADILNHENLLIPKEIIGTRDITRCTAPALNLIAAHITKLETEITALTSQHTPQPPAHSPD